MPSTEGAALRRNRQVERLCRELSPLRPISAEISPITTGFVEYLLELSEGVTGRIIEVLRRAALQGIADKTQRVSLVQMQVVGAKMQYVVGQRA